MKTIKIITGALCLVAGCLLSFNTFACYESVNTGEKSNNNNYCIENNTDTTVTALIIPKIGHLYVNGGAYKGDYREYLRVKVNPSTIWPEDKYLANLTTQSGANHIDFYFYIMANGKPLQVCKANQDNQSSFKNNANVHTNPKNCYNDNGQTKCICCGTTNSSAYNVTFTLNSCSPN